MPDRADGTGVDDDGAMSTTAPPTRRRRSAAARRGGAADLVRSLAVIAVVLIGIVVFVQAEDKPASTVRAVDYTVPVTVLRGAAPWPVFVPATPPAGWAANHVRTHVATAADPSSLLDLGFYVASAKAYAAVEQSDASGWVTTQLGRTARQTGTTVVEGVTWQTWTSATGQAALVRAVGRSTLVVDGKSASPAVIRELAASLTSH
jgi:hypothetical protein